MAKWMVRILFLAVLACTGEVGAAKVRAEIQVARLDEDRWRVLYRFENSVEALQFVTRAGAFRSDGWLLETPGCVFEEGEGAGKLLLSGKARNSFSVLFASDSSFEADTYMPVARFSDGGRALFLGHLWGEAKTEQGWQLLECSFVLDGLEGDLTLLPALPAFGDPAYAFFGPQEPREHNGLRLLIDPALPAWILDTVEQVAPAASAVYRNELQLELTDRPLALFAAGMLHAAEGYSIKGGALAGQFMMHFQGRDLLEEQPSLKQGLQKLIAHELAHLWQEQSLDTPFASHLPWIHEGGAEAKAVSALTRAGIWSEADSAAFSVSMASACERALEGRSLKAAVGEGDFAAVYPCGYLLYAHSPVPVFQAWRQLASRSRQADGPYTAAMLETVLQP